MNQFLFIVCLAIVAKYAAAGVIDLVHECYPNGTISVTNPDVGSYTNVYAVENEGSSIAVECSVSTSGAESIITGCSQDESIAVHFSNRDPSAADGAFGGNVIRTYEIECADIQSLGVDRTVVNNLGATLEKTTQAAVTPSFTISSAIRDAVTGSEVFGAKVGVQLYYTIDIPSEYTARASCTAYSGLSSSGSPNKIAFVDGCSQDSDLFSTDFDNVDSSVALTSRYYAEFYVFQFYNSEDVHFECSVKVCPSGSSSCDISCVSRKRSISEPSEEGEIFQTGRTLHIIGTNNTAVTLGSVWLLIAMVVAGRQ